MKENQWFGNIPDNWTLNKGKYIFEQRNDRGNNECLQLLSPTQKYGVIPQDLYELAVVSLHGTRKRNPVSDPQIRDKTLQDLSGILRKRTQRVFRLDGRHRHGSQGRL